MKKKVGKKKLPWTRGELLFCVILLWAAALFQSYGLYQERKEEEKTLETFQTLQLDDLEGCVEITSPMEKNYEEEEGKEVFLTGLIRELNFAESPTFSKMEKNGRKEICYEKETEKEKIQITYVTEQVNPKDHFEGGTGETEEQRKNEYQYVHFFYEKEEKLESLLSYKTKIERLLKMRNMVPTSNVNLKGSRSGKMSRKEKEEVTDQLFQMLQATEVEAVREEDLYTVYGYSPYMENVFYYGEKKINLNLAFSYDEEERETLFYLAMPYVQGDY